MLIILVVISHMFDKQTKSTSARGLNRSGKSARQAKKRRRKKRFSGTVGQEDRNEQLLGRTLDAREST